MTDTTNAAESGAGEIAPAERITNDTQDANKAPAAQDATAEPAPPEQDEAAKEAAKKEEEAKQAEEKRRNRTRDYIERLQNETRTLREQLAQYTQQQQRQPAQTVEPQRKTLEDFDYDMGEFLAYEREQIRQEAIQALEERERTAAAQRSEQERFNSYMQRADAFAEANPDFDEVVGSIQYPLHPALQAAIQAHPRGPELAYHLGLNDEDAFNLAAMQPHLAAAAVDRLAARLSTAPAAPSIPTPAPVPAKPITQAPPPPPTVGSRSALETPPEKLTDDEWYRRERERTRKR